MPVSAHASQVESPPQTLPAVVDSASELSAAWLVEQVLSRNPTLAQMQAAWQAAAARYPQVTSRDDPMFGTTVAPGSGANSGVEFGYRLEASQKIPWPGKLGLRGSNALAEAAAAEQDIADARLQLIEAAVTAFYDYFLIHRLLNINDEALQLLKELRDVANDRFTAKLVPQQDVTLADLEIGRQRERQIALERIRNVAVARINTLMNVAPSSRLPAPPRDIPSPGMLPPVTELHAHAMASRPDLKALAERIAAEQATLALAWKERLPDFEAMAAFDAFWQRPEQALRPQIGLKLNLPVRRAKRFGAISEAEARVAQRQAELERQVAQTGLQVEEAYQQAMESDRAIQLYEVSILPAARRNVEAARTAYVARLVPFLSVIESVRSLIALKERYLETIADSYRRRATLERVTGGPVPPTAVR